MQSFFAQIKKDIKLFFANKAGIVFILLPALLAFGLYFGTSDIFSSNTLIKPFSIAVRDYEDDIFTRTIINVAKETDIFKEVVVVKDESVTDEELFLQNNAVVITIPEKYLDDIYLQRNYKKIIFNSNQRMENEATICRTIFDSAIDALLSEQKAWGAEYWARYKRNTTRFADDFSLDLAKKAVNRDAFFSKTDIITHAVKDKEMYIYISITAMLCMLAPLSVLKLLPEERKLGIIGRYRSVKKYPIEIIISKYISGLVIFLIPWVPITFFLGPTLSMSKLIVILLAYSVSFLFFALMGLFAQNPSKMQMIGNIIIIFSMVLGGCFFPYHLLPRVGKMVSNFVLPRYVFLGFEKKNNSIATLSTIFIVMVILFLVLYRKRRTKL